jgi:hypothetical protein
MKNTTKATVAGKLSMAEFVTKAIVKLRNPERSLGIHTVYSGFNEAFKQYFELDKDQSIAAMGKLVEQGVVATRFVRGGVMVYLTADAPKRDDGAKNAKTLAAILN